MTDTELLCVMVFAVFVGLVIVAYMLAGMRDALTNIDYELCQTNLRELEDKGKRVFVELHKVKDTTE